MVMAAIARTVQYYRQHDTGTGLILTCYIVQWPCCIIQYSIHISQYCALVFGDRRRTSPDQQLQQENFLPVPHRYWVIILNTVPKLVLVPGAGAEIEGGNGGLASASIVSA